MLRTASALATVFALTAGSQAFASARCYELSPDGEIFSRTP
jgi:hypothetical protein